MINKYEHKYPVEAVQYLGTEESIKEVAAFIDGNIIDYDAENPDRSDIKACEFFFKNKYNQKVFYRSEIIHNNNWVVRCENNDLNCPPSYSLYNNQDFNNIYKPLNNK